MKKLKLHAQGYRLAYIASFFGILMGFAFFMSTGHDDSHISFLAAYAFAEFGELITMGYVLNKAQVYCMYWCSRYFIK